jgi:xanthine dehydrogenase YagS FAD-binding subunit
MRPFAYQRAADVAGAVRLPTGASLSFLAGGTTLLDLMKLDVMRPELLIDINGLRDGQAPVSTNERGLRLSAFARMAEVAEDEDVRRDYPVIAQSLLLAASAQLRNMATLGGNVLQRTRCSYFRDTSWRECNKRNPGSGCAALDGVNRKHAVLGVSDQCIAAYPGDFAQALLALDASVEIEGRSGARTMSFEAVHRAPGPTPHIETNLAPGELITGFTVPARPWARRSLYLKIRDRQSYEFALASAAVALDMDGDKVREARIAIGGVATKPWRAKEAEEFLSGRPLNEDNATEAGRAAMAGASPRKDNAYKVELGRRTVARALADAAKLKV